MDKLGSVLAASHERRTVRRGWVTQGLHRLAKARRGRGATTTRPPEPPKRRMTRSCRLIETWSISCTACTRIARNVCHPPSVPPSVCSFVFNPPCAGGRPRSRLGEKGPGLHVAALDAVWVFANSGRCAAGHRPRMAGFFSAQDARKWPRASLSSRVLHAYARMHCHLCAGIGDSMHANRVPE